MIQTLFPGDPWVRMSVTRDEIRRHQVVLTEWGYVDRKQLDAVRDWWDS